MSTHARLRSCIAALCLSAAPLLLGVLLLAGCGMTSNSSTAVAPGTITGGAFVIGTDAPVASVVSFTTTIQSIDAIDANGTSVPLLSGTPSVDWARYNGLQTLLDMNDVPADTYTKIVVTFATSPAPVIGYLQTGSGAPTIQTMNATFTSNTVTQTLANPLIVAATGPVGIHLDFRLDKSIQTDSNGNVAGQVAPTFNISAVGPSDSGAYIDEFIAGVVNPSLSTQSFTIQGPHGRTFTVNVNGQTEWDNGESLASLTSTSIVQISGILDKADATIDADEIAILSQDGFYAAGQITYVQPSSGPATNMQLYVRGTLPATGSAVADGDIAQVSLSGSEKYFIYWMHNQFTQFLFNDAALLPGQHVSVGGPLTGAQNLDGLTVKRVVLRNWGYNGTVVANSVNTGTGTFQMNVSGFAGLLVPGQPVTVYTASATGYRNGFTTLGDVSTGTNIRVVGLLIKDPTSGDSVILARHVDDMNN
ncbi:MAG TPA: DUF4382 domain-containing protein [Acidobacteriaceae bacterium]|jgi:hypothetical protein|nr:DUF4382 domain-containing protein [Acidobacteriaceae bacterium]